MQSAQNNTIYDVIIAGAGPVGLFLACELALAQCSVLILEKADDPHSPIKQIPFGMRGLSAPSVDSLYRRNLLNMLELHKRLKNPHQNAKQGAQRQLGHFAGIPFTAGNVDMAQIKYRLPCSTEPSLLSEMQELETAFTGRAVALGVEIRRGIAITGFDQDDDNVTVHAGNQTLQSKWLVGCDGARSIIRKTGGFEFAGTEPEFTGYTTLIDIADPEKLKPGRNITPTGMYLQSQPGYVIIQDFDGGAFHSSDRPITRGHIQEVLRRVSGADVNITALHAATTWTDRARQATTYRNCRVLLAGDAAHIQAPLGGQGLNLGLGDAMNLGWKLAATIHHKSAEGLLDTYFTERYPVGEQVLDWSRAQVAIMGGKREARALNAIFRDLIDTQDGATYFASRVWGVNMQYDLGSGHPLVGRSVPNFELEDGKKIGEMMYDGKGILLDFDSNGPIKNIAVNYSDQIRYISGSAKDQLGLTAVLIRPDGIIAWAAGSEPDTNELQQAIARWFVRN